VKPASAPGIVLCALCAFLCGVSGIRPETTGAPASIRDVQALINQGRFTDAAVGARALLEDSEARHGAEAIETARAIDLLLSALLPGGKSGEPETRRLAERAVAIEERVLGSGDLELARSLRNLAIVHSEIADIPEAMRLFGRVLAIREAALGPEHPDVAQSLRNLARSRQDAGDYEGARLLAERSLTIYEKATGPESPGVAAALFQLGWLRFLQGDFAGSGSLFDRTLAIQEKTLGAEHPLVATTLSGVASAAWRSGDFERARATQERCNAIREKILGPDHPDLALGLGNLGDMLRESGEDAKAGAVFERALAIQERTRGPEHPEVAIVLGDLAVLRAETGDRPGALALFERALAIREKVLGSGSPRVAEMLGAMGSLLMEMGDLDRARSCFERALEILGRQSGAADPVLIESLSRLAILHAGAGRHAEAFEAALRSEETSREQLRLNVLTLPERLALGYAAMRDPALDLVLTLASQDSSAESRRRAWQAAAGSRAMILDEMASRRRLSRTVGDPEADGLAADLAAARTRLAYLTLRGLGSEPYESFARLLDDARRDKERLERSLAERSAPFRREQILTTAGLRQITEALPSGWALVAYTRYASLDLKTPQDAPAIPPEKTGRSPIRDWGLPVASTQVYAAFVLRQGDTSPAFVPLGPAGPVEEAVQTWRDRVSATPPAVVAAARQAETASRDAGVRLRRLIWDPLSPLVRDARQVLIVPEGPLHLINFSALPSGRRGYLVETGPSLHYLSTERDIALSRSEVPAGHGWLALGGPDFDTPPADSSEGVRRLASAKAEPPAPASVSRRGAYRGAMATCETFRARRWENLPLASAEVEAIESQWRARPQETFLSLTDDQASEAIFKRLAPGQRGLHLATHGFFLDDVCPSALRGNPRSRPGPLVEEVLPALSGDTPLLLSGLVMAGANLRPRSGAGGESEDGILTAEEVASLDLSGVEWVVLSACGSGLGQVQSGEGVLGLRRAFQTAGARTLIMSLWRIKDDAAMEWMSALYRSRLGGASTPEAIRRASLEILARRRSAGLDTNPFWWGAFVAAGDWR